MWASRLLQVRGLGCGPSLGEATARSSEDCCPQLRASPASSRMEGNLESWSSSAPSQSFISGKEDVTGHQGWGLFSQSTPSTHPAHTQLTCTPSYRAKGYPRLVGLLSAKIPGCGWAVYGLKPVSLESCSIRPAQVYLLQSPGEVQSGSGPSESREPGGLCQPASGGAWSA